MQKNCDVNPICFGYVYILLKSWEENKLVNVRETCFECESQKIKYPKNTWHCDGKRDCKISGQVLCVNVMIGYIWWQH